MHSRREREGGRGADVRKWGVGADTGEALSIASPTADLARSFLSHMDCASSDGTSFALSAVAGGAPLFF